MDSHGDFHSLTSIVLIATVAMLLALAAVRFRMPIIVGYILTGFVLGQLGLLGEREAIVQLAELGIILLLFFAGTEMRIVGSVGKVWHTPIIVCAFQLVASLSIVSLLGIAAGWSIATIVLMGFCFALSSTALTIGMTRRHVADPNLQRNIFGVLVVQDLLIAPMLVIMAELATSQSAWLDLVVEIGIVLGLLALTMLAITRTAIGRLQWTKLWRLDTEISMLVLLAAAFGGALVASLVGVTPAFGAFLAGLLIGNGKRPLNAARKYNEPIQALLMMVFFVSIGLLVELPSVWWAIPLAILAAVTIAVVKTVVTALGFFVAGSNRQQSLQAALLLGQVGEFSFVLGAAGLQLAIISDGVNSTLIIMTVFTLLLMPLVLPGVRRLEQLEESADSAQNWQRLLRYSFPTCALTMHWTLRSANMLMRKLRRSPASVDTEESPPDNDPPTEHADRRG